MRDDFKIAWRNLWRNKRRTIITSASVLFAVFFAVIMRSVQLGSYDNMIINFIESFTGYIQVQHAEFHDNPVIDHSFEPDDKIVEAIKSHEEVVSVTPHIESFILASSSTQTKGVILIAIDPVKEKSFSNPEDKLVRYRITSQSIHKMRVSGLFPEDVLNKIGQSLDKSFSSPMRLKSEMGFSDDEEQKYLPEILKYFEVPNGYLSENDDGILVSARLANFLRVYIGDSIILIGQGYHGVSAAGIFPVRGIIKMPSPDLDNKLIIMTIPTAQKLFNAEGRITAMVINLKDKSDRTIKKAKAGIESLLVDKDSVAKTWYELNPVLYQQIQGDSQTGLAMLGILYFIIFFGIYGTVLMMVSERNREFGVLVAIGMQKKKLIRILMIEMLLLGTLGLTGGMATSIPVILYYHYYPVVLKGDLANMMIDWGWEAVMPTAGIGPYLYWQAVIVAMMILLVTLYPIHRIKRLKEVDALRN
jgi:ABC-type lipoprotein release transport system permease subunit